MSDPCLEIVVFKVKNPEDAKRARRAAQNAVRTYEGFISWCAYEALEERNLFADLVLWRDQDCAKRAATRVVRDPEFAALLAEIDGLLTMSHFRAEAMVEADSQAA